MAEQDEVSGLPLIVNKGHGFLYLHRFLESLQNTCPVVQKVSGGWLALALGVVKGLLPSSDKVDMGAILGNIFIRKINFAA